MKLVVQKFGGTSVATAENREKAVEKVISAMEEGYCPVIVVSAMGRKGSPYATDTLIEFTKKVNKDIHPREMDLVMSCGETISAVIMASTLRAKGIDAVALTGEQAGIITDNNYGNAEVIRVQAKNIYQAIDKGKVPVIAGFQGVTEYGDITTLGRGGSDVSAAIIGEALDAHLVEIYTDVDGVMTADPRIVPDAKVINSVDYTEVFQLADYGAKVIHPRAVEIAMQSNLPMVIKNTFTDSPGTLVTQFKRDGNVLSISDQGLVTGIAHMHGRTQVIIDYDDDMEKACSDDILDKLAALNISIDLINIFTNKKVFTVDEKDEEKTLRLLKNERFHFNTIKDCSKVTIIGSRIRGVPGVMARILKVLSKNNIIVYQTADSHTTISVLVKKQDAEKAVLLLHNEFKLGL